MISRIPRNIFYRSLSLSTTLSNYKFYDLVVNTPTHPSEPIEAYLMSENEVKELKKTTETTLEGNYKLDALSPEEKIAKVFGGRIRGEAPKSSSRTMRGEPKVIAGITVPDKPREPDNCCMSGCINCVWELYDDDVKDWKSKRKEAAKRLVKKGGRWPENFHPPIKYLNKENLPLSLAKKGDEILESSRSSQKNEEEEAWENVPISIRVFAEMEKKMKAKKKAKKASSL